MSNETNKKDGSERARRNTSPGLLRDEVDREILNLCQGGFPLVSRPFKEWATKLDISEDELISRLQRLNREGALSRFGPVINKRALGGNSTLVATSVPEDRFEEVASRINDFPQVSHNYRRDHDLNMWFVVSAESEEKLDELLERIRDEIDLKLYDMPMLEEYCIGVNFQF